VSRRVTASAQDEISIGSHFIIVAGLRYDRFDIRGIDLFPAVDRPFGRTDAKISPRFGMVYKPIENISVYGSYSQTFLPRSGDQFLTLSLVQENLAPEKFANYEIGAKWDILPNLSAAVALFKLDRSNATTPDPVNPASSINIGQTRTKGAEFSLTGQMTEHWQITGGYSYQDAALKGNDTVRLAQVPRHQASLWNRYNFSKALGAGIGVIHQASQFAAIRTTATTTILPAFTRVDAALFYAVNDRVKLQANVENLFNTRYFSDAHNNNNISSGAPVNGRISMTMKF
jgi:catecholate siderophore receptor